MKKVKVTIAPLFDDCEAPEIPGYDFGVPGLVVHRTALIDVGGSWKLAKNEWNLTHVRSGTYIGHFFRTRKEAVALGKDLDGVLDWTMTAAEIWDSEHKTARYLVRDILKEHRNKA